MASKIPDHWLWLGLGVITFFSIRNVSHGLREILTLTTIRQSSNMPAQPQPTSTTTPTPTHQEDSIKTSSLLTLSTSHNTDIRLSATKILCTRFAASDTAKALLIKDLYSTDDIVAHRAHLAFNLLCDMGAWSRGGGFAPTRTDGAGWTVVEAVGGTVAPGIALDGREEERAVRRRRREAVVISEGFLRRYASTDPGPSAGLDGEESEDQDHDQDWYQHQDVDLLPTQDGRLLRQVLLRNTSAEEERRAGLDEGGSEEDMDATLGH
ncbi:hypothetical protein CFE70_001301 [Pyrenophora teres f. teres 0-1]|uniref:Uncharacterized protein n=1 Tax=Pyrenophora teres f. teres (strain 0-1) TaxID=861557 RepID=E3S3J9_PYRTT|nr:hypothetical protein PTT_17052 [Pyrenophora teres f. teres 0-1]